MLTDCPECGGRVLVGRHIIDVHIGRRTVAVEGDFLRCEGECREVYFAPGEMDAAMISASNTIRSEEGLLTPAEIRRFRKRIGLTQPQLEELLGAGPKTVTRWEKGTVIQNGATDTLLRVLHEVPEALTYLLNQRAIVPRVVPMLPATRVVDYQYASVSDITPRAVREPMIPGHDARVVETDLPFESAELVA